MIIVILKVITIFQDSPVMFGMRVLHCQEPPGLELFGHAPQFNANNFSHVFKHGSRYGLDLCIYRTSSDYWFITIYTCLCHDSNKSGSSNVAVDLLQTQH